MKFIKYIFFFILILIIGASLYIATLDGNYNVQQTRVMKVPTEVVYNNINNYKNWELWNPWHITDPTNVISYPENTTGVGASFTWTGKNGLGLLKTISTIPNKELLQEISLGNDIKSEMYWDLQTANDSTVVTWGIKGQKNFSQKIHWLLNGGIETSIEPMLKDGLALLNEKLLEEMDIHAVEYKGIVDYGGGYYLYQTVACKINDVPKKMAEMFPEIINYMTINSIEASGKPFTLNHQIDTINNTVMFSTCIPIKERIETESNVLTGYLEPLSTYKIIFKGNYKFLPAEWPNFYKNLNKDGYTPVEKGFSFEVYTINPQDNQNPAEWLTEIYIPIKIEEINDTTTETNQTNL